MTIPFNAPTPLRITSPNSLPGVGLSICPGKCDPHAFSGPCKRNLKEDIETIKNWGAVLVITLMEEWELKKLNVSMLGDSVKNAGMLWWHWNVIDGSPLILRGQEYNVDRWRISCLIIHKIIAYGFKIFVHCRGGLGRTGTLVARLLIEEGISFYDAMQQVRKARPGAIETIEQENYLFNIAEKYCNKNYTYMQQ